MLNRREKNPVTLNYSSINKAQEQRQRREQNLIRGINGSRQTEKQVFLTALTTASQGVYPDLKLIEQNSD